MLSASVAFRPVLREGAGSTRRRESFWFHSASSLSHIHSLLPKHSRGLSPAAAQSHEKDELIIEREKGTGAGGEGKKRVHHN